MIAILLFYFSLGLASLSAVYDTIFNKENISLTAEQLINVGIWAGLPWSIKIMFGTMLDGLLMSRRFWSLVGQVLMIGAGLAWVDFASSRMIISALGEYHALILVGFIGALGTVLARLSFDVQSLEATDEEQRKKLQVASRAAMSAGLLTGAVLSGPLAAHFSMTTVFVLYALCPVLSFLVTVLAPKLTTTQVSSTTSRAIMIAFAYSVGITLLGASLSGQAAPLAIFVLSLLLLSGTLARIVLRSDLPRHTVRYLLLGLGAIFLFRVTPGPGPGLTWYYLDVLKLSKEFLGLLRTVEALVGIGLLGILAKKLTTWSLRSTLIFLSVAMTVLQLPDLLIVYGLTGGVDPRHLLLVDGAVAAGLAQIAMVPLGLLIATRSPTENKAVFFALTSSLMNLSLLAGDLLSRTINQTFVVTRTDFSQLPHLLLATVGVSVILSVLGILLLPKEDTNSGEDRLS
jgi:hypothetical protein